ncbi:MAG TPA: type III-B CRISPR module RAMP protein Cmr1 [Actinobacteria bacterium]|nr:type III-B CRISPR module RAMP protein Cmr1 [Actinomycetota bacterium]
MEAKTYNLTALTDIWTGDIDGKPPGRLITTGLLGSIRWWFEVVVRGLGGSACDPSAQHKTCQDDKHCVVCELFGCTGWARKFRFDVFDESGHPRQEQITKNTAFKIRFTPLRPIRDEEWALLDLTLRLIANYGALGGKTVYKPTAEKRRQDASHHQDYGIVRIKQRPDVDSIGLNRVRAYVGGERWRGMDHTKFRWASLEYFWCIEGKTLARQDTDSSSFNHVLGRKESKSDAKWLVNGDDATAQWLAGSTGNSKKVFSFRDPARTFGFVKPGRISHDDMLGRLKSVWPDMEDQDYVKGNAILDKLFKSAEVSS